MNLLEKRTQPSLGLGARCLVVDDFEAMRRVTTNQLRQLGVEHIHSAKNGAEALRMLRSQRFDVVLSDWNMPVMSGLELLQELRNDEKLFSIPFILITAEAERSKVEEAVAHGVTSMLLKPYTPRQLAIRLEKALTWKPRAPRNAFARIDGAGTASGIAPPATPLPSESSESKRPTILIVDDTPDNLLVMSQLFKGEYRVRLAQTGAKALELVMSDDPPDLVLLDIMMPNVDGFEVAQAMREHPSSETIPIIFVTAMTTVDARLKGLNLGAVDYITKPIDPETLVPRVRNFMRYVQLRRDLQAEYDSMVDTAKLREDVERMTRHDLKAPLAGALGLVQSLIESDSIGRREMEQLRLVEETVMQALNMVNLSSELYKIETGRFVLRPTSVPIGDLLRRIVEMDRLAFAEKRLSISVDADVAVGAEMPLALGDITMCYSAFQNLLKNACEAAPVDSKISVELLDQNPLQVVIRNTGAVPMAIRDRFFEKFVTSGKASGTGIGTYSARLLIEAQNGRVGLSVFDATNTTEVSVSLPRALE
jgi:two-component system sensor histidine kinase/response regulator